MALLFTATNGRNIRIDQLFHRLRDAHLTINVAKCEFARATVTYLTKLVGQG